MWEEKGQSGTLFWAQCQICSPGCACSGFTTTNTVSELLILEAVLPYNGKKPDLITFWYMSSGTNLNF